MNGLAAVWVRVAKIVRDEDALALADVAGIEPPEPETQSLEVVGRRLRIEDDHALSDVTTPPKPARAPAALPVLLEQFGPVAQGDGQFKRWHTRLQAT